jgi:hypothetical protein
MLLELLKYYSYRLMHLHRLHHHIQNQVLDLHHLHHQQQQLKRLLLQQEQ